MKQSLVLLGLSLSAIITMIVLDILGIQLGVDSMAYLRMMADLMAGAGLGVGIKGVVDAKSTGKQPSQH